MTTQTLTLTAFLLARIAEDEMFWDLVEESKQAHPDRIRRYRAECEAKRDIVLESQYWEDQKPTDDERHIGAINAYRRVLDHLALPYADHPDYREEWKP